MSDTVLVPKADLARLEAARLKLYKLYIPESLPEMEKTRRAVELSAITEVMWELSHRRYPEMSYGPSRGPNGE